MGRNLPRLDGSGRSWSFGTVRPPAVTAPLRRKPGLRAGACSLRENGAWTPTARGLVPARPAQAPSPRSRHRRHGGEDRSADAGGPRGAPGAGGTPPWQRARQRERLAEQPVHLGTSSCQATRCGCRTGGTMFAPVWARLLQARPRATGAVAGLQEDTEDLLLGGLVRLRVRCRSSPSDGEAGVQAFSTETTPGAPVHGDLPARRGARGPARAVELQRRRRPRPARDPLERGQLRPCA